MKRAKKGSLQLSINSIVILILAITMIGLGLSFIKGIFGGTVEKLKGIETQLEEEERKQLLDSQQEITFLSSRIKVEGREKAMSFAIRNVQAEDLTFDISTSCNSALSSVARAAHGPNYENLAFETYNERFIEGTKADVLPMVVKVNPGSEPTIYSCVMEITPQGSTEIITKRFEVEYSK